MDTKQCPVWSSADKKGAGKMYGILLESVQFYIIEEVGEDVWKQILEHAGHKNLVFSIHNTYDDEIMTQLAHSCHTVTKDKDFNQWMTYFGTCFVEFCAGYGYDKLLQVAGRNYRDFLQGIDNIHEMIRFSYPRLQSPSFLVLREDSEGCELLYQSKRMGFKHYVIGQLQQIAKRFYNVQVTICVIEEVIQHNKCNVKFRLNFDNRGYQPKVIHRSLSGNNKFSSIACDTFLKVFPFCIVFNSQLVIKRVGNSMAALIKGDNLTNSYLREKFQIRRPLIPWIWSQILQFQQVIFELEYTGTEELERPDQDLSTPATDKHPQTNNTDKYSDISSGLSTPADSHLSVPVGVKPPGISALGRRFSTTDKPLRRSILLKGQMKYIKDWDMVAFLCSPLVNDVTDLWKAGMYLHDLNMFDMSRDMVFAGCQHASKFERSIELQREKSEKISENMSKIEEWTQTSDSLLYSMIPKSVASKLKSGASPISTCELFENVTIMFNYMVGFSDVCCSATPMDIVKIINSLFILFDKITDKYDVFKVETLGDAVYMVAGGVPDRSPNHAINVASLALELQEKAQSLIEPWLNAYSLNTRIGMHTGSVVGGVVGRRMPQYCLFGDTVNTASRMQTYSMPGRIHISQPTRDCLHGSTLVTIMRGTVNVKGKGDMRTYWLAGHEGEDSTSKFCEEVRQERSEAVRKYSSYENAMDLHGMHTSTSFAQIAANFSCLKQNRSSNRLHDGAADDNSRSRERSLERSTSRTTSANFLSTGSSPCVTQSSLTSASSRTSLTSITSRTSPPRNTSRSCLSSASSVKSFISNDSIEESEEESMTPPCLGAKPKFTITSPVRASQMLYTEFLSKASGQASSLQDKATEPFDSHPEGNVLSLATREGNNEELPSNSPGVTEPESINIDIDTDSNKSPKGGLSRSKFKLSLPKLAELPTLVTSDQNDTADGQGCLATGHEDNHSEESNTNVKQLVTVMDEHSTDTVLNADTVCDVKTDIISFVDGLVEDIVTKIRIGATEPTQAGKFCSRTESESSITETKYSRTDNQSSTTESLSSRTENTSSRTDIQSSSRTESQRSRTENTSSRTENKGTKMETKSSRTENLSFRIDTHQDENENILNKGETLLHRESKMFTKTKEESDKLQVSSENISEIDGTLDSRLPESKSNVTSNKKSCSSDNIIKTQGTGDMSRKAVENICDKTVDVGTPLGSGECKVLSNGLETLESRNIATKTISNKITSISSKASCVPSKTSCVSSKSMSSSQPAQCHVMKSKSMGCSFNSTNSNVNSKSSSVNAMASGVKSMGSLVSNHLKILSSACKYAIMNGTSDKNCDHKSNNCKKSSDNQNHQSTNGAKPSSSNNCQNQNPSKTLADDTVITSLTKAEERPKSSSVGNKAGLMALNSTDDRHGVGDKHSLTYAWSGISSRETDPPIKPSSPCRPTKCSAKCPSVAETGRCGAEAEPLVIFQLSDDEEEAVS